MPLPRTLLAAALALTLGAPAAPAQTVTRPDLEAVLTELDADLAADGLPRDAFPDAVRQALLALVDPPEPAREDILALIDRLIDDGTLARPVAARFLQIFAPTGAIAPPVAGLAAADGPSCGGANETGDPTSHCALSTVLLTVRGQVHCTGVAVTERSVLTAAHCVCPTDLMRIGATRADLGVVLGDDEVSAAVPLDPDRPPSLYPGYLEGPCGGVREARRWGDLAVVHLAPGGMDGARTALAGTVAARDAPAANAAEEKPLAVNLPEGRRALALRMTADPVARLSEISRTLSHVGAWDQADWQADIGGRYAFFGFGIGPDRRAGVKRAGLVTLREVLPCATHGCAAAPVVQEVTFQDDEVGTCESDSGGGVFKATRADPGPDHGRWALVGIMSGGPATFACHDLQGALFDVQVPRRVVRLDTPAVRGWLDAVLAEKGETLDPVAVLPAYAPLTAADP